MSEQSAHEERLEQLGAADSARARQMAGLARGREKVAAAVSLYESMSSEDQSVQAIAAEVRRIAREALPAAIARVARVATGHIKAPESTRIEATKLIAGAAQVSLQAAPGAAGAIPLNEMGLGDLEGTLTGMLASIQQLRSIEGQAQRIDSIDEELPHQGSTPPAEGAPG